MSFSGLLAALIGGCGETDNVKTTFFVRILKGNAPDNVVLVDVEVQKDTTNFSVPLTNEGGGNIVFPITRQITLPSDQSGAVVVTATARDVSGAARGRARTTGSIVPGQTITLELEFGVDTTVPDGGMPADSGVDGEVLGEAMLRVAPGTRDYGSVVLGAAATAQTYTVSNIGQRPSGPIAVALMGGAASHYQLASAGCAAMVLAPAATCTVSVSYHPSAAGTHTVSLQATGTPGGTALAVLTGMAVTPASGLGFQPATHDYGAIVVGQNSAIRTFTVTNSGGSASGTISIALAGPAASQFNITADNCNNMTLAAGASCMVTVRFSPTSTGNQAASLTLSATPGGSGVATLTGQGIGNAALSVVPGAADVGTLVLGNSADATFVVSNNGGVATGALAVTRSGPDAADVTTAGCDGITLGAGASCTITAHLLPTTSGGKMATLTISGTPGGAATASIAATVVAPSALSVSPSSQPFGSAPIGADSAPQTFTVRNNGGATTGNLALVIRGTAAADYRVSATTCGAPLGADATCTITVIFRPTAAGGRAGSLEVTANPGGLATASMSGSGQALAQIVADAGSHDFGTIDVGMQSGTFTWTLRNAGDVPTGMLSSALTGDTGEFTVTNSCNLVLMGGQSCTIVVRFIPTANGARTLAITTQASPGGIVQLIASGAGRQPQALTVVRQGNGSGSVSSTPAGVDCGNDCDEIYPFGTTVTLSAAPAASSVFSGWAGGCTGMGACVVQMNGPRNVVATFVLRRHTLTVAQPSNGVIQTVGSPGGIDCGADCIQDYDHGSQVTLHATPALGFVFNGWTGACSGTADCVLDMTAPRTVGALFAQSNFTLAVDIEGGGSVTSTPAGINCDSKGGTCETTIQGGTMVTLTPSQSSRFRAVWITGPCTGQSGPCSFPMTGDTQATVRFIFQFFLDFTVFGQADIVVNGQACPQPCHHSIDLGAAVTYTVNRPAPPVGDDYRLNAVTPCNNQGTIDQWSCAIGAMGSDFNVQVLTDVRLRVTIVAPPAPSPSGSPQQSAGVTGPGGLDCDLSSTVCTLFVPFNTTMDFRAEPRSAAFLSWGGDCAGTPPTPGIISCSLPSGPHQVTATFVAGGAISANVFAGTGTVHDAAFANQNGPAEYISCPSGCFSNVPPGQRWMHAHADDVGFVPSWDAPCIQPPTTVGQDSYCLIDVPVSQTSFVAVGFFDGSCGGSGCNPNP